MQHLSQAGGRIVFLCLNCRLSENKIQNIIKAVLHSDMLEEKSPYWML